MKMVKLQSIYATISHLSKREKMIFYAVVVIISLAITDRLIIGPVYSKMKSLDKEIREKELSIKKNLHIVAQKDRILAERAKYGSFLTSPQSEDEEMTSLLKEIETLANKSSIYLVDMKPAGLKTIGSSKKYTITLNCEAQMEQLVEFMYSIENSNKILTIDKYQTGPKSRESSVAKCNMSISRMVVL